MNRNGNDLVSVAMKDLNRSGDFVWKQYQQLPRGSAWCCGAVSLWFEKNGTKNLFYGGKPVFYVPYAQEWCEANLKHVKMADAKPGDIVIFTWSGNGYNRAPSGVSRDHIGLIRKAGTSTVAYTIEGNTRGGIVAERKRALPYIYAIYRPKWKEAKPVAMSYYRAIDVSEWQGDIDWKKVKADGIDAAIVRYADGDHLDPYFDANMKGAIDNGIHVGCYIFSRATTIAEAREEAERLFAAASKYKFTMPLYLDMESNAQKKTGKANAIARAYLVRMRKLGAVGGIYASLAWWKLDKVLDATRFKGYPLWIAQYGRKCTYPNYKEVFGMWQYTASGKVNGIKGKVDRSKLYVPYWKTSMRRKKDVTPKVDLTVWLGALEAEARALKKAGYKYAANPIGKKKRIDCSGYVRRSLQRLGLMPDGSFFYLGSKINGKSKNVFKNGKFEVSYPNKTVAKAQLKPGDICGFAWGKGTIEGKYAHVHTMVYAGKSTKGSHLWYSFESSNNEWIEPETRPDYTKRLVRVRIRIKDL